MADQTPILNRKQVNPGLKDLLDIAKKDVMLNFNCHAIAVVESFNSDNQTLTASIAYKKSFLRKQSDGSYKIVQVDYPPLVDVPVLVIGGGAGVLSFPIAQGDECIVFFNDRDIDNWFKSGQIAPLASGRLHSFSDGIALVGLHSLGKSIADYDMDRVVLKNGTTLVGLSATKVKIANDSTTLNTLLGDLITAIKALTTTNAVVGAPCAISPASQAALDTIATQLGGLLE